MFLWCNYLDSRDLYFCLFLGFNFLILVVASWFPFSVYQSFIRFPKVWWFPHWWKLILNYLAWFQAVPICVLYLPFFPPVLTFTLPFSHVFYISPNLLSFLPCLLHYIINFVLPSFFISFPAVLPHHSLSFPLSMSHFFFPWACTVLSSSLKYSCIFTSILFFSSISRWHI